MGLTNCAVTSTMGGDLVVWSDYSLEDLSTHTAPGIKSVTKCITLYPCPINYLCVAGQQWLVTGGEDGSVRVYDFSFRSVFWYEKLHAGPVQSISFTLDSRSITARKLWRLIG